MGLVHETNDDRMHTIGSRPTPPSNVIPPPGPDVDLHGHLRTDRSPQHLYDLGDVVAALMAGLFVGAFIVSLLVGCR
jgi:hypothetical protein